MSSASPVTIAGIDIGRGSPCRFVAEIGANHNGSLDLARRLIDAAHGAGADFVKFQAYTLAEIVALRGDGPAPPPWAGRSLAELYREAHTPLAWFPDLAAHCRTLGIPWFASVFGEESLAALEALDCPAYKIAALDFGRRELREMLAATGKPLVRSCPTPMPPAGNALYLYCPPGYPQREPALRHVDNFHGFSFHGDEIDVPLVAVARGASIIEAHIMLDDAPANLDASFSLLRGQFEALIEMSREIEAVLG